jgi:hypothetical protein
MIDERDASILLSILIDALRERLRRAKLDALVRDAHGPEVYRRGIARTADDAGQQMAQYQRLLDMALDLDVTLKERSAEQFGQEMAAYFQRRPAREEQE